MSLTYKQIIYIFDRCIDWAHLADEMRIEMIKKEFLLIDWDSVPDDAGLIDYKQYYLCENEKK